MSEDKERLEHWRELAELLGVEGAPRAEGKPALGRAEEPREPRTISQRKPEPQRRAEPERRQAPERPWRRQPEAPATTSEDTENVGQEPPAPPAEEPVADAEPAGSEQEAGAPEQREAAPELDDDERHGRRGRRGRRGGRRREERGSERGERRSERGERRPEGREPLDGPGPEGAEELRPDRDRHEADAPVDEADEIEAPQEPEDTGVEQELQETVAEWNVPSWTELIDSLYRPGR